VRVGKRRIATGRAEVAAATRPGFVVVGGGAAAYAAAVALRRKGVPDRVLVVSDDTHEPYDRTLLTKDYLDGKFGDDHLPIARASLADLGVEVLMGVAVTAIHRADKEIALSDGRRLPYRKLLLATGSEPARLDVPGADLPQVGVLRSVDDCRALLRRLDSARSIVVVGSSFIGLEAAASLRSRDLDVTVVTPEDAPMAKKIGRELSDAIVSVHQAKGVRFRLGAGVARIDPGAVTLEDGCVLPADAVVVGIGVKPRTELAEAAGLAVENGVTVDAQLRTSDPDIYAAGDIARWPDPHSGQSIRVEHWVVAERQGAVAAANMAGGSVAFTDVPFFWSKHFDFSFRYVGHAEAWDAIEVEGELAARRAVLSYRKGGQTLAVATVGQDLRALEIARDMEHADG
jgi:apoptosis-inducing factor 3